MSNKIRATWTPPARPGEPVPVSEQTRPADAADTVKLGARTPPRQGPTEDEIRVRAHALWEQAGRPEGDGVQFWLEAERELTNPR